MKKMKHMFSALTAAAMLVSGMAVLPATSAEELWYGDLCYETNDGYVSIVDCNTDVTTVEIPAEIDGLPVAEVDAYAFNYCDFLSSITVAAGNTSFCSVDGILFSADKTVLVEYPHGKTDISYTIPAGVTTIGADAFSNTVLENVTIPDGVTEIGQSAFQDSRYIKKIVIPEGVTKIAGDTFGFCYDLAEIEIPDTVTSIDGWAFCYCKSLTEINLPDSVTSLGTAAFQGCEGLTSITLPDSITNLSFLLFTNCSGLKEVHLPSSITYISGKIFEDCAAVTDVYYDGLQSDWEAISIDEDNEILNTCTIHFSDGGVLQGSAASVPTGLGDLDANSSADSTDASMILVAAANIGAEESSGLTAAQETAADVNSDGALDAVDASCVLKYATYIGTGGTDPLDVFVQTLL